MRTLRLAAFSVAFLSAAAVAATPDIRPEAVLEHIKYLASDDLKGRANGSEGLEQAADYIAQQFKAAGLRPGGSGNDWFQPFELQAGLTVGKGNALVIETRGATVRLVPGANYYPLAATPNDSTTM